MSIQYDSFNMTKLAHIDLVIFDLDETLIDWVHGKLFPDVPYVLKGLRKAGYKVALASYNSAADQMLRKFGIRHYFDWVVSEHLGETLADNMLVDMAKAIIDMSCRLFLLPYQFVQVRFVVWVEYCDIDLWESFGFKRDSHVPLNIVCLQSIIE